MENLFGSLNQWAVYHFWRPVLQLESPLAANLCGLEREVFHDGVVTRSFALWVSLGLSFFGSLLLADAFYPRHYIWSRTVISSLASPRDNPRGYWIAVVGLMISGLLMIPFELILKRRLGTFSPWTIKWAGGLFIFAAVFLVLAGPVVPGHYRVLGIGRTHEHLAQISGVAFCLSLICYLAALRRVPRSLAWLRFGAAVFIALPVVALICSRLALVLGYEFASPALYQAIRSSLWNSLALWEWVGAGGIYLFLGMVTLGVREIRSG